MSLPRASLERTEQVAILFKKATSSIRRAEGYTVHVRGE